MVNVIIQSFISIYQGILNFSICWGHYLGHLLGALPGAFAGGITWGICWGHYLGH